MCACCYLVMGSLEVIDVTVDHMGSDSAGMDSGLSQTEKKNRC